MEVDFILGPTSIQGYAHALGLTGYALNRGILSGQLTAPLPMDRVLSYQKSQQRLSILR